MDNKWIVLGITGVTCGGKTTLSKKLTELISELPSEQNVIIKVISQDDYFLEIDDKRHTWVEELQHIHFDIITSLDMDKMYNDIQGLIGKQGNKQLLNKLHADLETQKNLQTASSSCADSSKKELITTNMKALKNVNLLILEGFSIFEHEDIFNICHLKYFFTLDYVECKRRRLLRTYEPPDCDGYFDVCVWPEYIKYLKYVQQRSQELHEAVTFFQSNDLDRSQQVILDLLQHVIV